METSSILENSPNQIKSVISYDVEDNGDLPGVELWKGRRQPDYESPPISPFTEDNSTLITTTPLILIDSYHLNNPYKTNYG